MTVKAAPARSAEVIAPGAPVACCEGDASSAPLLGGEVIRATQREVPPSLSKSQVVAGLQCQRRLWLECFAPELAGEPDPSVVAILEHGTEIGRHAHALFPGGVLVDETTQLHPAWRSRVPVRCAGQPAEVAVDQIRTVSKVRLGDEIGALTKQEAAILRRVITEMYGE